MNRIIINDKDAAKKLNDLAREEMKLKLLNDIMMDLVICNIEKWDYKQYIEELHKEIDNLVKKFNQKIK